MTNENQNTEIEVIKETEIFDEVETTSYEIEMNENEEEFENKDFQEEKEVAEKTEDVEESDNNTKVSAINILKSKAAFEDYTVKQPMPLDVCEILENYPKKPVVRIADLTQNIETLINKIGNEDFDTNQYLVWFISREKDEIVKTIKKLNGTNGLGIFIMKTLIVNDDEIGFECLLQPELKEKIKRTINTETPAKQLQKVYWDVYFEECDEQQSLMQVDPQPRHYQPVSIGKKGIQIMQTINTQHNYIASEIGINNDKTIFEKLLKRKEEIESEVGELEWDSKEKNKSSKIRKIYLTDVSNLENYRKIAKEHIKMAEQLKDIAYKYL